MWIKQQRFEWRRALKIKVLWLGPVVIAAILLVPLIQGTTVTQRTTPQILKSMMFDTPELMPNTLQDRIDDKDDAASADAEKIMPYSLTAMKQAQAGKRNAFYRSMKRMLQVARKTSFRGSTASVAGKNKYFVKHRILYGTLDVKEPLSKYLIQNVFMGGNTLLVMLIITLMLVMVVNFDLRHHQYEFDLLIPSRPNVLLFSKQLVTIGVTALVITLSGILMAIPIVARYGLGQWTDAVFSFSMNEVLLPAKMTTLAGQFIAFLWATIVLIVGVSFCVHILSRNLFVNLLVTIGIVLIPVGSANTAIPGLSGLFKWLPGFYTDTGWTLRHFPVVEQGYDVHQLDLGLGILWGWTAFFMVVSHVLAWRKRRI